MKYYIKIESANSIITGTCDAECTRKNIEIFDTQEECNNKIQEIINALPEPEDGEEKGLFVKYSNIPKVGQ